LLEEETGLDLEGDLWREEECSCRFEPEEWAEVEVVEAEDLWWEGDLWCLDCLVSLLTVAEAVGGGCSGSPGGRGLVGPGLRAKAAAAPGG
jgi:hypothetical protein